MMCFRRPLIMLLIGLCGLITVAHSESDIQVLDRTASRLLFRLTPPEPQVQEQSDGSGTTSAIEVNHARYARGGRWRLPYRPVLFSTRNQPVSVSVLSVSDSDTVLAWPLSPDTLFQDSASDTLPFNLTAPRLRTTGSVDGMRVWSVDVTPYIYESSSRTLHRADTVLVEVVLKPDPSSTVHQRLTTREHQHLKSLGIELFESRRPSSRSRMLHSASGMANGPRWKLVIEQDGWYRITGKDLQQAGVDLFDVHIPALQLRCEGQQIPIYVDGWKDGQFDVGDSFEFWGETRKQRYQDRAPDLYQDLYDPTQIYWLSWSGDRGTWMVDEQGTVAQHAPGQVRRPYSFYETVHVERDRFFDFLSEVPPDSIRDHWFFDSGIGAAEKREYPFDLAHPDDRSTLGTHVRVMMGGRGSGQDRVHKLSVYLNDQFVKTGSWTGQDYLDLHTREEETLPAADLHHGRNTLTLLNLVDRLKIDYVMLNWFEIIYPRLYRAEDNMIRFRIPPDADTGPFLFKVDGFSRRDIDVFKIGNSRMLGLSFETVTDYKGFESIELSFEDYVTSYGTEYIAVAKGQKLKPAGIVQDEPSFLRSADISADYMVIAHPAFIESAGLDELIQRRQAQGYHVLKVNLQNVFDEFSYGRATPEGLKSFLDYAYHHWQDPGLRFVLLVGDGSRNRRRAGMDSLDFVPVYLRQTFDYGATASDHWYALLDGDDDIADVAVGRLPVRTVDECDILTRKIIRYETESEPGAWQNRLLFIGGNFSAQAPFDRQVRQLVSAAPAAYENRLLLSRKQPGTEFDPHYGGTANLLDYLDQGCSVINFHGHGGGGIWADNGLLRIEDVSRIYGRNRLPFVMSMTCFTGAFESPVIHSLADALLFHEQAGSMAFLGASGKSWVYNDFYLQREILAALYQNPTLPVGELIRRGKIRYQFKYSNPYVLSEVHQYHLLGDPAMCLNLPGDTLAVFSEQVLVQAGDSLHITVDLPFPQGHSTVAVTDSDWVVIDETRKPVFGSHMDFSVPIPESFTGRDGHLSVFAEDDMGLHRLHGSLYFSLRAVMFDSVRVLYPDHDRVQVQVYIHHRDPLQQVGMVVGPDSLSLEALSSGWYQSEVFDMRGPVSYRFYAIDISNRSHTGEYRVLQPDEGVDLAVQAQSVSFGGGELLRVSARVENHSGQSATSVPVLFEHQARDAGMWHVSGRDTVKVDAYSTVGASVPVSLPPGSIRVRVTVDPDTLFDRGSRYDNRQETTLDLSSVNLIPGVGMKWGEETTRIWTVDSAFTLTCPEGSIGETGILSVSARAEPLIHEQPAFESCSLSAYKVSLSNPRLWVEPVTMELTLPPALADSSVDVFQWHAGSAKWIRQPSERKQNRLVIRVADGGTFTVLQGRDSRDPRLEVILDGRMHVDRTLVSPTPRVSFIIQDENGVDLRSGLSVSLDGQTIEEDQLSVPDSVDDGNRIQMDFQPELDPGQHTFAVRARDCYGNASPVQELVVEVAEAFSIQMLGTYPNPFEVETVFSYILSQPCDELSIRIYTASGRLIRHLDPRLESTDPNPFGADYHEVVWDGTDDEGFSVANGVYFYKIKAKFGNETHTQTGKIARIL